MANIMEVIASKKNFRGLSPATKEQIQNAQEKLGITFSTDYKEYIMATGVASFDGHELTGVCSFPRLDVISTTERCREELVSIKPSWYVIEELNIDQTTIWQDADGSIYRVTPQSEPLKIARDLIEYINL